MTKVTKVVGVIGGLGPAATHDFLGRIIARTKAARDQDHLRVLIDNNPKIPDRNAAIRGEGPSPAPMLVETALELEAAGAEVIVMACNTAHVWEDDIRDALRVPFLSMIDETLAALEKLQPSPEHVGVLAVDGARAAKLYDTALNASGRRPVNLTDDEQRQFMNLIYTIKAGNLGPMIRSEMQGFANTLVARGAKAIIAGCTEVPLVLSPADVMVPLVSSTDALVERAIRFAGADLRD